MTHNGQFAILKALEAALNEALLKLDKENEEWVAETGRPEREQAAILDAVNAFEEQLAAFFREQQREYADAVGEAQLKADDGIDEIVQLILEMVFANEEQHIIRLAALYEAFADPLLAEIARAACDELVRGKPVESLSSRAIEWLENHKIRFAREVQQTTHDAVIRLIQDGFRDGKGRNEVAQELMEIPEFDWKRSRNTARTESNAAANAGTLEGWRQSEVVNEKEWMCAFRNSRDTHTEADGQRVPLEEPFFVGGYEMMHPGDSSLGAPAEEVCGCKCTMRSVIDTLRGRR